MKRILEDWRLATQATWKILRGYGLVESLTWLHTELERRGR